MTVSPTDRYLQPGWFTNTIFNPLVRWATRRGLSVAGSRELLVVGRTSGEVRATAVNLLTIDGRRYLVAPRGTTQWVRNLRAAGEGELRVGRRTEAFVARELDDADKAPVLRAYLERWAWEVGRFFDDLDADSSDDEVAAAAPGFPVFEVLPR
jgi:deazaflavin-dependent oxidoreductase (nitroreductase family)